jgi:RNA polymerase sigma factor (TIGR02999 family)
MPAERPHPSPQSQERTAGLPPAAPPTLDQVWERVYGDLKRLAHRGLAAEPSGHTLSTTALVHEVYLRLRSERAVECENRALFFTQAARAMRRVLVDYARRHRTLRRGEGKTHLALDTLNIGDANTWPGLQIAVAERAEELLALDEALERLGALDARLARVIECRFFAGLTESETAEVLGVTARTVARDWVKARAWLRQALEEPPVDDG